MKKISIFVLLLLGLHKMYSQVGINTETPAVTLHIEAKSTTGSRPEGLIAPRLSGDALRAANLGNLYGNAQNGAIVYVVSAASASNLTGQTVDVTSSGFYFFDAPLNKWVKIGSGAVNTVVVNKTAELLTDYTAGSSDDIILFSNTVPVTLTLPTTGLAIGKMLYVSSNSSGGISFAPAGVIRNTSYNNLNAGTSATLIFLGSGQWDVISGY